jgi:hypothetical protein
MNDPHVLSLEYALETDESLAFDNPPPLEGDAGGFSYRLADGVLTVTLKDHYATQEQAVEAVAAFIRGWELDYALQHGRRELRFRFVRSHIIDRQPTPGAVGDVLLAGTAKITLTGHPATLVVTQRQYPAPPVSFTASPDVETLWNRYEGHLRGSEPLPAMGYFCLTVLETVFGGPGVGTTPKTSGKRKRTAHALNVELAVLEKLGALTSERGGAMDARKYAPKVPHCIRSRRKRKSGFGLRCGLSHVGSERTPQVWLSVLSRWQICRSCKVTAVTVVRAERRRKSCQNTYFHVGKSFPCAGPFGSSMITATLAIGRSIDGGSHADLAAIIRAKVAAGLLPPERPAKMWVGPGAGTKCDGCDLPITTDQREYEFDPTGWPTIRLHQECLEAWHAARLERDDAPTYPANRPAEVDTWGARLAAVLRESQPSGYCIDCLAAKLDLPPKEVRDAAQVLVARPGFRVIGSACYTCGSNKDSVVVFVPRHPPGQ